MTDVETIRSPSRSADYSGEDASNAGAPASSLLINIPAATTSASNKRGRPRKEDADEALGSSSSSQVASEGQRRKEQNRAAQRAFRERKEKHVKELETRNEALSATVNGLANENSNLKDLLARLQKENVALKRTALICTCTSASHRPLSLSTTISTGPGSLPAISTNISIPVISSAAARPSNFHKIGCPDGFLA